MSDEVDTNTETNTETNAENNRVQGPFWAGRNWAAAAGEGSIHDDATASELGFRGGTVPGDVHLNQFAPVLQQVFGDAWFEQGNLSLNFKNATVDGERVCVFAQPAADDTGQARVWMEREDGLLICTGSAALVDQSHSELRHRDLRPCDPKELRILRRLSEGLSLGEYPQRVSSEKQFQRFDAGLISDSLELFRHASPWGGPIACPSTLVQYLWGLPMDGLREHMERDDAVGLFGAIEVGHLAGPVLLDCDYVIRSEVISVGQSPKTEYLWFDSTMATTTGKRVANFRMMLRFMKASSSLYSN